MKYTSTKFWKNYDRMQTSMAKACMPRTAALVLAARTSSAPKSASAQVGTSA